VKYTRY